MRAGHYAVFIALPIQLFPSQIWGMHVFYNHLIGGLAERSLCLLLSPDKLSYSCMLLGAVFRFSLSGRSMSRLYIVTLLIYMQSTS